MKSRIEHICQHSRERGWRNLRLLSLVNNSYNREYHGERPDGSQWSYLNVFVQREGRIYHFYGTE